MTEQNRQYMVDVDDPNLRAFLDWHDQARANGTLRQFSFYSVLKMAFMAGKNTLRQPELAPSRDVLPPAPPEPRKMLRAAEPIPTEPLRDFKFQSPPTAPGPQLRYEDLRQRDPGPHRTIDPDPFDAVKLSGPQQAAMDRMYPLPNPPAAYREARGALETQMMPALEVSGPLEALPDEHPAMQYRVQRGDSG